MKQCPRCASEITKNDKVCPRCKLPVDKMKFEEVLVEPEITSSEPIKSKKQQKKEAKQQKKEAKRRERIERLKLKTDFSKYAINAKKDESNYLNQPKSKKLNPRFEIDENGEFNINTSDVELVGEEKGKILEEQYKKNYSVKKARGDYREPKIKWWELYKFADRSFARRKIKKEVNKASKIKPEGISKGKLLCLAIFLGWTGAQNFYVRNYKKGMLSIVSFILWVGILALAPYVPFFASIQISVAGCAGFVDLIIWASDIINIAFGSFKYRTQKEAFIFSLNVKTRAKLGEKYIDEELYYKPWYVKLNIWFKKKKRGYEEWRHERRQRLIEKEKAKQAKKAEQEKVDAEVREFEEKENQNLKIKKLKTKLEEENVVSEISKFEGEADEEDKGGKPSAPKKPKAKVIVKNKKKK